MSAVNARELRETTLNLKHTVRDLRDQLKQIRKLQLNMVSGELLSANVHL